MSTIAIAQIWVIVLSVLVVLGLWIVFIVTMLWWAIRRQNYRASEFAANGAEPCPLPEEYLRATWRSRWITAVKCSSDADYRRSYDTGWMWTSDEEAFTGHLLGDGVRGSLAIRLGCQGGDLAGTVVVINKSHLVRRLFSKPSIVSKLYLDGWQGVRIVHPDRELARDLDVAAIETTVGKVLDLNRKISVNAIEVQADCAWVVVSGSTSHLVDAAYLGSVRNQIQVMVDAELTR